MYDTSAMHACSMNCSLWLVLFQTFNQEYFLSWVTDGVNLNKKKIDASGPSDKVSVACLWTLVYLVNYGSYLCTVHLLMESAFVALSTGLFVAVEHYAGGQLRNDKQYHTITCMINDYIIIIGHTCIGNGACKLLYPLRVQTLCRRCRCRGRTTRLGISCESA